MNKTLKDLAIAGNILFFLWIVYNGIEEGGSSHVTPIHVLAYLGILILLILNAFLLSRKN